MSPPIQLFLTTIASQPALRQRQEYLLRILQVKKIPFTSYDLASDETAKRLWKRKAPLGIADTLRTLPGAYSLTDKQQLPGILVGGRFPGVFAEFEDAVEYDELDTFLRLKEPWNPDVDEDEPAPPVRPIGVPGAMMPLQMTPERLKSKILAKPVSSPLARPQIPVNKREGEFDISTELSGYGLQGVRVTEDELRDLVAELGLDGDDAGDLVKGLSSGPVGQEKKEPEIKVDKSPDAKVVKALEVDKKDREV
ncbi:hypothetical protein EV421DRAFT_2029122 [Armillaria borealis]|uniref:Glutaredoxin domain-containing protein n=1 Tax=Armillaria borealis TaxID=47425 RepID=A0AA39K8Q9_9AGAR|nr:hypothetical protein EV421DRAFT_2029122 [Armillaria borealis]